MKRRSGFTLIELMITLATGSALLAVAIGLVHRTMTLNSTARNAAALQSTAARFSQQWRHDLHRAEAAILVDETLTLTFGNMNQQSPLSYQFREGVAIRSQSQGEGETHRESFEFGPRCQLEMQKLPEPERIRVTLKQAGRSEGMRPRTVLQLETSVGHYAWLLAEGLLEKGASK